MQMYETDQSQPSTLSNNFNILNILSGVEGVYVQQKLNSLQAITGCQQQNIYYVFQGNFNGEQAALAPLFVCQEQSECFQRVMVQTDCRAFSIYSKYNEMDVEPLMEFQKDYSCVCCCANRPEMNIRIMNKGASETIGRIYNPWFCNCYIKGQDIFDGQNNIRYRLRADACQLANFCYCPCQACQYMEFKILDPADLEVGKCIKRSAGCFQQCFANTDHFQIQFPKSSTPRDRALLLGATILLDYRYFEHNRREVV